MAAKMPQCSPAWKTGTIWMVGGFRSDAGAGSQCSPAWKTGTIGWVESEGGAAGGVSM